MLVEVHSFYIYEFSKFHLIAFSILDHREHFHSTVTYDLEFVSKITVMIQSFRTDRSRQTMQTQIRVLL